MTECFNISKINLIYFVGIDLSLTGTGIAILEYVLRKSEWGPTHEPVLTLYKTKLIETTPDMMIEQRYIKIWNEIKFTEKISYCGGLFLEGLSYGSMGQRLAQLAGLHYYIRTKLVEKEKNFEIIPPTTLKKFVAGKGNVNKNVMLKEAYKKWGVDFNNDNLCDAYCLARMSFEKYIGENDEKSSNERVDT